MDIIIFPNLPNCKSKSIRGNHVTSCDTSKSCRYIPTSISIYHVVIYMSLHKLSLMIDAVDNFLSDQTRNQVKTTDTLKDDKQAIGILQQITLNGNTSLVNACFSRNTL